MKKVVVIFTITFLIVCIVLGAMIISNKNKQYYTEEDFNIERLISQTDYDNDGIDDYTDILEGARIEAKNKPKYKNAYYSGGYPPEDEGVCTDVIWRALKNAGYMLKDMIDEDIKNNVDKYPRVQGKPDPNIDFRRVPNLKVYFERNQISLTTDLTEIEKWQAGDIVIFGNSHVGIISDKRNKTGVPYLIHNGGQPIREEDILELYNNFNPITGHYRMK
ncbi:MAG: DUF1287 domain-containing protein [Clostridia bacterium]|nr:DUF1287 domain-containing protein [Clostridia bacterium]